MKLSKLLGRGVVVLATCGLLVPASAVESIAEVSREATAVHDIALQQGGTLVGQVVNPQGKPLAEVDVVLHHQGKLVAQTNTDEQGVFQVTGLQGGTYSLRAGDQTAVYRLWAHRTAPPSARNGLLMVQGDAVRAQLFGLADQYGPGVWLVGGMIGTVIAISVERDGS
jgi:hypothetical protein